MMIDINNETAADADTQNVTNEFRSGGEGTENDVENVTRFPVPLYDHITSPNNPCDGAMESTVAYFDNDPLLLIFNNNSTAPVTTDIVTCIINGVPDHLSAKLVPSQPMDNISFMVNVTCLQYWKDVL